MAASRRANLQFLKFAVLALLGCKSGPSTPARGENTPPPPAATTDAGAPPMRSPERVNNFETAGFHNY